LPRLPDHRVRLALKRPWSDGTYALEMDALALLSRYLLLSFGPPQRPRHGLIVSSACTGPVGASVEMGVENGDWGPIAILPRAGRWLDARARPASPRAMSCWLM
jgi:hypothetical protein